MRFCRLKWCGALLLTLMLLGCEASVLPVTYFDEGLVQVVKVVDGDTIHVETEDGTIEKVRLIGVDTPETVHPNKPVECFGREASTFAKANLLGEWVGLEVDPTQSERDRYDRILRYVWLNGENFNEWIIQTGHGYEYTYDSNPYVYQSDFLEAQQYAREEGLGLWAEGAC